MGTKCSKYYYFLLRAWNIACFDWFYDQTRCFTILSQWRRQCVYVGYSLEVLNQPWKRIHRWKLHKDLKMFGEKLMWFLLFSDISGNVSKCDDLWLALFTLLLAASNDFSRNKAGFHPPTRIKTRERERDAKNRCACVNHEIRNSLSRD